ncbi:uncharacterized protein VTP21DRAFT_5495 [Calcarisporiella thermophila]|uniref:uncharacterized protein n=1 Tax=Calcarisporiella thermophila TaxID=911321 RepID=UPI00374278EC
MHVRNTSPSDAPVSKSQEASRIDVEENGNLAIKEGRKSECKKLDIAGYKLEQKSSHDAEKPDNDLDNKCVVDLGNVPSYSSEDTAKNNKLDEEDAILPFDHPRGWFVVLSSFLVNFYCFGTTYSWGVYQEYDLSTFFANRYTTLQLSFIGSLSNGLMISLGIFVDILMRHIGYRKTMLIGCACTTGAFILASFSTELWQLYLTQGILNGIGTSLCFFSSITLPAQYFLKRRGLATGLAVSSGGIGGLALSPMVRTLIDKVGYQWSLRVLAFIGLGLLPIASIFVRPRLRTARPKSNKKAKLVDFSFMTPRLVLLVGCGFFISFGFFTPFFYVNTFALHIGVDRTLAATLTGVMSGVNSLARVVIGLSADYFGRVNTMLWSTMVSGLAVMIVWPFANCLGILVVLTILYGWFGGAFISLYSVIIADLVPPYAINTAVSLIYTVFIFGYVFGPPISGALLDMTGRQNYIPLAEFAGAVTVVASLFILALRFSLDRNLFKKF